MNRENEMTQIELTQLSDLIASVGYYERIVSELGDALEAIASPGEELNIVENRMKVLATIAEVRSNMKTILEFLSKEKACTE